MAPRRVRRARNGGVLRADDASQRLFYYVCELQRRGALRGPTPHVFDIALLPRESSAARTVTAIEALARALGVEPGALPGGIERANALRRALDALQQRRAANGPQHERIGRAALWSDATQWFDHTAVPTAPAQGPRVLLAGSVPPDDRLHGAVEDGGACVVAEAHVHGLARLGPEVSSAESSAEVAIARQLRHASISPRAILDRAAWLVAEVRRARAAAVVLWLTREDEALAWHVPAQRAALAAAGIPALILPAADWAGEDGALERIAAFCARIDYAGA